MTRKIELRAPFPWFGGKALAAPMIWRAFGNVPNYVEPFFGSGATLLARPHAPKVETVNDKDGFIANFWRAIKHDPEAVAHYCDEPVNEADLHAKHKWLVVKGAPLLERLIDDPEWFDPKIAGWWCWGVCTWIGNGWCHKDERVQKQKRRPELNAANGRGVNALGKKIDTGHVNGLGVHTVGGKRIDTGHPGGRGGIIALCHRAIPKIGTPGHGIHAPSRKMPRNARGATGVIKVAAEDDAPPAGKKPLTHRNKGVNRDSHREGGVIELFEALAQRLRHVRVVCGNWDRVLGRSTLGIDTDHGMTPCGILLDPPYDHELRDKRLYREDARGISADVREWAIEHGDHKDLRIALCGQVGEHKMPGNWTEVAWASTSSAASAASA